MKRIKYFIHYDVNNNEGRGYTLAATNKAEYIIDVLNKIGYGVDIVSLSLISNKGYIKSSETQLSEKNSLIKLTAFKWGNIIQKIIAYAGSNLELLFYLLFKCKKNEEIIVYHSLANITILKIAKTVKKFKMILETEEIYNDVIRKSERKREKEIQFIKCADKYIFPTEMLSCKVNDNKPYCIIHGTYQVEENRNVSFYDDKIHVVYAGTFDPRKGGVLSSVCAAMYLPKIYHVHILGFGNKNDIENIRNKIEEVNKKSKATVTYDGLLAGEEYIRFIQKCHIGLSTQNPDAEFNATSFPSKILSYMANGLRVVSIRIPAIETSAIGNDMYYYNEQTPENIAKAIMAINFNDGYDGRKKIEKLDKRFSNELKRILS